MTIGRSIGGIFCDDIRQEIGGKISLVGCYTGTMMVESLPASLPKLCAHVRVATPADRPFDSIKFIVLRDEDVLFEADVPSGDLEKLRSLAGGNMISFYAQLTFSPFEIPAPCSLKVRAIVDGETIKGLGLAIKTLPAEMKASSS